MSVQMPVPKPAGPAGDPSVPVPVPRAPRRGLPARPGAALTMGLCLTACLVTAAAVGMLSSPMRQARGAGQTAEIRTAVATVGGFEKSLRVGGTLETLDYAAIRAPQMRGPRDSGRAEMTLATLAEGGSLVSAGSVVAEFELKWLQDHIEDRQSVVVTAKSDLRKRESDIVILQETERQARVAAKAEYEKATLDLRTAEVKSEIEAEILRNLADEALATWRQLEDEGRLMEVVHGADLRGEELKVREQVLHVERHERDYERLQVRTPIDGMVVRETMFNRSGQFAQTKEGDQVYPGALFMRIVDISSMVLAASVNQVDAQSIRIGNEAVVELDAYPGERFSARVVDIGAVATSAGGGSRYRRPSTGAFVKQIPVRIILTDKDARILPDLSASADVKLWAAPKGVLVPREALREGAGGESEFVYLREGGRFVERAVRVADLNDTQAWIETGLAGGEEVLLSALPASEDDS